MSTEMMIEADHLTKFYGEFPAVTDISFSVAKGEIMGFLGPNAAGKTTTMRILTGYMPPSSGTARIGGYDVVTDSLEARRRVGYLPETVPLYTDLTVKAYLEFMGAIRGMDSKSVRRRTGEVIEICRLEEYYSTLIGKLSKGFRQRVGIAQAIIHEPDVLVLDEPTIGIDPIQVVETRQLIKDLGGEHTIILSTHILPEVTMICERVIIIHEGEVVAIDRPQALGERLEGTERVRMRIRGPGRDVTTALRKVSGVQDVTYSEETDESGVEYTIVGHRTDELRTNLARAVVEGGWGLLSLEAINMSLEEIFLRLTTTEETA